VLAIAACGPRTTRPAPGDGDGDGDGDDVGVGDGDGDGDGDGPRRDKRPAADTSRKAQCQQHVQSGLRATAGDIVTTDKARVCVRDTEAWEDCLDDRERERLAVRADQRQSDCERWTAAVAACVLDLPTKRPCTAAPPWREPIDHGPTGPPIAWSIDVDETSRIEPVFAFASDGTLIVADATGIRGIRDGTEQWQNAEGGTTFRIVNDVVAIVGDKGIAIRDVATGESRGETLDATTIAAIGDGAAGKLIALAEDGRAFDVTPASCKQGCSSLRGALPNDELPDEAVIGELKTGTVFAGRYQVHVVDRKMKRITSIVLHHDGVDFVNIVGPSHIAVVDPLGVALLDVAACRKAGRDLYLPSTAYYRPGNKSRREPPKDCAGCKTVPKKCIAAIRETGGEWQLPATLSGAIAFNDHGPLEATHLITTSGGGWEAQSGGHGEVAGDDRAIYTVSLGPDGEGPVDLVALDRATGKALWHTLLVSSPPQLPEYDDSRVVTDGKRLAVRLGGRLYAIDLPAK
jgi:outer membrane protein assembly factor BamB